MLNPEGRIEWLNETMAGRRLNGPLVGPGPAPDLSISNVEFREAPQAFAAGLFMATVLTACAACEIFLTERFVRGWDMREPTFPGTPADFLERARRADDRGRWIGGLDRLLASLNEVGQWIPPAVAKEVLILGSNRNDLAHYRPIVGEVLEVDAVGTAIMARFTASHLLDPQRQEANAIHALTTMFDLWDAPVVGFNPAFPPSEDWTPPSVDP